MSTKWILVISAVFMAVIGVSFTFLPDMFLKQLGLAFNDTFQLFIQLLGALYFAFAMLNWTAKGSLIGGIYNKPVSIANFTHFVIGAITLVKAVSANPELPVLIWVLTIFYIVFALLFGMLFFRSPV